MKHKMNKLLRTLAICGVAGVLMACGTKADEKPVGEMEQSTEDKTSNEQVTGGTEQASEEQSEAGQSTEDKQSKVYEKDGYLAENTDLLNERMLEKAGKHFTSLYEKYLEPNGIKPYFVIIPDKNYYLSDNTQLQNDFDEMVDKICGQCDFMTYIDIREKLALEDYYHTDSHWKQECIGDVAEYICGEMGNSFHADYKEKKIDHLFKGSYYEQITTDIELDEVCYLTNEVLEQCSVTKEEGMGPKEAVIYNMEKAAGDNPYDMFLEGAVPFVTIENPNATSEKKLIVFRDSFASSITPLMAAGYKTITLVDIRYVQSGMVGGFVEFKDSDVLFLYSSILLNNSAGMK